MFPALSTTDNRDLRRVHAGKSFDEVRAEVKARAVLALPDLTVTPSDLRVRDDGLIEAPVGVLTLTEWSRMQLARMLGIARWDRWFASTLVSPKERAEELNRRLSRLTSYLLIRARKYGPGEEVDGFRGDGVLRAFLSATYTPIDDLVLFEKLGVVLGGGYESFRFCRVSLTDRSSHYVATSGEEVDVGFLGKPDLLYPGFILRNSEVGFTALSMDAFLWRLVCTNGLIAVEDRHLLHRVHRGNWDLRLSGEIAAAFSFLPTRWERTEAALRAARNAGFDDPVAELRRLVEGDRILRPHRDAIEAAYTEEPESTRYGIAQAITRAARTLAPDLRFEFERIAGEFVLKTSGAPYAGLGS